MLAPQLPSPPSQAPGPRVLWIRERRHLVALALVAGASAGLIGFGVLLPGGFLGGLLGRPSDYVDVVLIRATFDVNLTDAPATDGALDVVRLPHCSFAYLSEDGSRIDVYGAPWDTTLSRVVLVRYVQDTSFSGGGDDQKTFFLRPLDVAAVPKALKEGSPLYSVLPGVQAPMSPAPGTTVESNAAEAHYTVNGTLTMHPQFQQPTSGNFSVVERHVAEVRPSVAVIHHGMGVCA